MIKRAFIIFTAIAAAACGAIATAGCSGDEQADSWQLTGSISANFSDDGNHGYILTVEGSGAMPDYQSESATPWYGRAGRVTEIVLGEGITYVGDYTFSGCSYVDYIILPDSVSAIGSQAFNPNIMVCSYNAVTSEGGTVYTYSQNQPSTVGDYWHMLGGVPAIWQTLRVLFIGNSFTYYNDLPSLFASAANGAGAVVEVDSVTCGSWTLAKFADANDEYGAIVEQKLSTEEYDAVVLQEQSTLPIDNYNSFLSGASALKDKIDGYQADCSVYMYATWGFPSGLNSKYTTIPDMEAALRSAYSNAAKEIGASVSSVGEAFTYVYNNYPQINLYNTDQHHPSYEGSYLAACVHAATITGCDPRESTYEDGLDGSVADILQQVAYNIVFGA